MTNHRDSTVFLGKSAIIFDFDGTIADTLPLHERAFEEALAAYPLRFRYADYAGMSTRKAISMIFAENELPLEEELLLTLTRKKQLAAHALYAELIAFMPGAEALVRLCHTKKFRLFVASSGSRLNVHAGLEALGIKSLFTGIFTADDVEHAKPYPDIFLKVLEQYAIPAAAALVLEDALSGLRAAAAAGITAVSVDPWLTSAGTGLSFVTITMDELKQQLHDELP
jgi:HAD superfamily hydrolase (TIGR01509 family)